MSKSKRLEISKTLEELGWVLSPLQLSLHAIHRWVERTGLDKRPDYKGPNREGVLLSISLAHPAVKVERLLDSTAGNAPTEFHCIPAAVEMWGTDDPISVGDAHYLRILLKCPPLVAVVRNNTVLTLLTQEQYQHNKDTGCYLSPEQKPLPLTNTMEQKMTLASEAREWAVEFFTENPDASVHEALKAANNAHVPPVKGVFSAVKAELMKERIEKAPPVPQVPVVRAPLPTGRAESAPAMQQLPVGNPELVKLVREIAAQVAVPMPAPVFTPGPPAAAPAPAPALPVPSAEHRIRTLARELLTVMRDASMDSLILTITDRAPKPGVTWEATYNRSTAGEFEL